jgi:hypothetical protein
MMVDSLFLHSESHFAKWVRAILWEQMLFMGVHFSSPFILEKPGISVGRAGC